VRVVTETKTVEVPVEVTKPLPESLTDPLPYPPSLPENFTVGDLIDWAFALLDTVDVANADRASAAELTQPSDEVPQ
jgi:hypothetical protein